MRKMCPNHEKEGALDTVLEVPMPEEMFAPNTNKPNKTKRYNYYYPNPWSKFHIGKSTSSPALGRSTELQLLLGVIGAPLVPLPVSHSHNSIVLKKDPIEASMAKYIMCQYVAATGGDKAIDSIQSMYAMGKVRMSTSESQPTTSAGNKKSAKNAMAGDFGGFMLWQKRPDLWCLELVISGCKIGAGSDGKVVWRHTPWQPPHISRGPPRPLRRSLQGLDPRQTANLFSNALYIGEKLLNGDSCFVLRLDADTPSLRSRSSNNVEIIQHTVWGYFSQRTGLLQRLDDSHLLRIKSAAAETASSVFWETTMESIIDDYRAIDGVYIAHSGRTTVSLYRFGDNSEGKTRTRMEEVWKVEEVEFNIKGLSMDCFLPPAELKWLDQDGSDAFVRTTTAPLLGGTNNHHNHNHNQNQNHFQVHTRGRSGVSKVVAVDDEHNLNDHVEGYM